MGKLKVGAAVTIVYSAGCILTRVAAVAGTERFVVELDSGDGEIVGVEGVMWLSGWHTPRSKPVLAALAAQALVTDVARPSKKSVPPGTFEKVLGHALGSFAASMLTKGLKK